MPFTIDLTNDTVLFGMPDTIIEPRDAFQQLLNRYQELSTEILKRMVLLRQVPSFPKQQIALENGLIKSK